MTGFNPDVPLPDETDGWRPHEWFELPVDLAGSVFDPTDDTFGPIMAKIQRGDFVDAARDLLALERRLTVRPL